MKDSNKKRIFMLFLLISAVGILYVQADFPNSDYWSLNAGFGTSNILVDGMSFQFVVDPKLWLSPALMVGSRLGINYSTDEILTFEGQAYLRWNFLRLGSSENTFNVFLQGGIGMLAAYRGDDMPFDNPKMTRGSLLGDVAAGVTIPLSSRWNIEPSIRGGYPHMGGFSITAGYKFPLPRATQRTEYVAIIRTVPPNEIIRRIMITAVEFVLFGPDIGRYNAGVAPDAQALNDLVLGQIAEKLNENPGLRVRIEGHANPVTDDPNEADELMALSAMRANAVAQQLILLGVDEEQLVIISFGGTRTVTSDHDIWNRNRRVELILIQVDPD